MVFGTMWGSLIVCNLETGATVATLQVENCRSGVIAITFLTDGRLRAGFRDGTFATWDSDLVLGSQCEGGDLGSRCKRMVFSNDGTFVSTLVEGSPRGRDHTLRMWTFSTQSSAQATSATRLYATSPSDIQTVSFELGLDVSYLAFSPSSSHLAFSTDEMSTLYVHQLPHHDTLGCTSRCLHIPLSGKAHDIAWSPTGDHIACSTQEDCAIYALDGTRIWSRSDLIYCKPTFSLDGRTLGTADEDLGICMWGLEDNESTKPAPLLGSLSMGCVKSIAFSVDGARIVSQHDRGVKIWDARADTGCTSSVPSMPGDRDVSRPVALSPDGGWLATRSKSHSNIFHIWNANTGDQISEAYQGVNDDGDVEKFVWVSTGTLVIFRESLMVVYELHPGTGVVSVLRSYRLGVDLRFRDAACSPDGSHLLVGCEHLGHTKDMLLMFNLTSNATEPAFIHTHDKGKIYALAWSSKDTIAYGGYKFARMFSWHHPTSSHDSSSLVHHSIQDSQYWCRLLSFSHDGALLAAYSYRDDMVWVYDARVTVRTCLHRISLRTSNPVALTFSSSGRKIYTDRETYEIVGLRGSDIGVASDPEVVKQAQSYGLDSRDERWVVDQDGTRAGRLPPLDKPQLTAQRDKVAIWDDNGRLLLLQLK